MNTIESGKFTLPDAAVTIVNCEKLTFAERDNMRNFVANKHFEKPLRVLLKNAGNYVNYKINPKRNSGFLLKSGINAVSVHTAALFVKIKKLNKSAGGLK